MPFGTLGEVEETKVVLARETAKQFAELLPLLLLDLKVDRIAVCPHLSCVFEVTAGNRLLVAGRGKTTDVDPSNAAEAFNQKPDDAFQAVALNFHACRNSAALWS